RESRPGTALVCRGAATECRSATVGHAPADAAVDPSGGRVGGQRSELPRTESCWHWGTLDPDSVGSRVWWERGGQPRSAAHPAIPPADHGGGHPGDRRAGGCAERAHPVGRHVAVGKWP